MKKKVSEILKLLNQDDWILKNQKGSHRHFVHLTKKGKVTIAGKPSKMLEDGTVSSIFKQAGWK